MFYRFCPRPLCYWSCKFFSPFFHSVYPPWRAPTPQVVPPYPLVTFFSCASLRLSLLRNHQHISQWLPFPQSSLAGARTSYPWTRSFSSIHNFFSHHPHPAFFFLALRAQLRTLDPALVARSLKKRFSPVMYFLFFPDISFFRNCMRSFFCLFSSSSP